MTTAQERARLSLVKLRLAMVGTWALITGVASLLFVAVLTFLRIPLLNFYTIIGFVVVFHVFQWLIGPYIIGAVYRTRPAAEAGLGWVEEAVNRLSMAAGMEKPPKTYVAEIDIPNAFAFGSPLTGPMVAVTRRLVESLPREEVEAVIGHELGHIKHRDVAFMMAISIIPAIIYYLGYTLFVSGAYSGRREGGAYTFLIGIALMVFSFIFNIFVFYMSRLREYYADYFAAKTVPNGARNLQRALVRIMMLAGRLRREEVAHVEQFKAFFIADPEVKLQAFGDIDRVVEEVKNRKPSTVAELFSTHPDPAKRLRALDNYVFSMP
ncbi:peptidase M48 [Candidatus Caldarchaeum subterraneum]|mgnify:CR=1 FL=1|uniref:Protease HtpX homolog n=1 Tax=Caldiarchaeum subterraneum TaxID=311458 RepID=E6N4T3_CALS0|nr:peptidase M48 [Candidatus Caldarchaeum subterraneum]BAJ50116.1 peptidase M48 [Candidatus Caldarchaeum subterraneum]